MTGRDLKGTEKATWGQGGQGDFPGRGKGMIKDTKASQQMMHLSYRKHGGGTFYKGREGKGNERAQNAIQGLWLYIKDLSANTIHRPFCKIQIENIVSFF